MTDSAAPLPSRPALALRFDRQEAKLDRDDRVHADQRLAERITRILTRGRDEQS